MDHIKERIDRLHDFGFTTKAAKGEDIFELAGLRDHRDSNDVVYEPIAPYLIDYIKNVILPDETDNLARILEKTERSVRKAISTALSKQYPESWEEVLRDDIPKKDDYLENLRLMVMKNDSGAGSLAISKLNVLAFNDYYRIIRKHWDIMSGYFSLYQSQDQLKQAMNLFNESRNTSAHLNLEILNGNYRQELREECDKLIHSIALHDQLQKGADMEEAAMTDEFQQLIGRTVMLQRVEATKRGAVRGIIQGTEYGVSLSPNYLKENGISIPQLLHSPVRVKITRWDTNANKFNAELV